MSLLSRPVLFDPFTGDIQRTNDLPPRALAQRQVPSANKAAGLAGVGRVSWAQVEEHLADWEENGPESALAAFVVRFRLTKKVKGASDLRDCFLAKNAKTAKPRKGTGRSGQIVGLALFPHFYPNVLNAVPEMFLDDNGVVDVPQLTKAQEGFAEARALGAKLRTFFNAFDGARATRIEAQTGVPPSDQLNFCVGSSEACRSTCLVLTGNNPASTPAVAKKANLTQALLTSPALFIAGLYVGIDSLARAQAKKGIDTVVRLNMLSDLPWYAICPELLESLANPARQEARVYWYDYSKIPFWRSPEYQALGASIGLSPQEVLDLTFSFAGSDGNTKLCREALDLRDPDLGYPDGVRVAVAFASADPKRRATVAQRTTWDEILSAGMRTGMVQEIDGGYTITLPELGTRLLVDGDDSDYRIDDPGGCIVALNFKEPMVTEKSVPGIKERIRSSRESFTAKVPVRQNALPIYATGDAPEALASGQLQYPMFQVGGLLLGPHVPTVLDD